MRQCCLQGEKPHTSMHSLGMVRHFGQTTRLRLVPSLRCDTRGPSSVSRVTGDPAAAFVVNLAKGPGASRGDSCKYVPQSWENQTRLVNLSWGLRAPGPAEGQSTESLRSLVVRVHPMRTHGGHHVLEFVTAVICFEVALSTDPDMLAHPDFPFVIGAELVSPNPALEPF